MTVVRHFPTFTAARTNLRALLDAADQGLVTTLQRDQQPFVVVPATKLAEDLRRLRPAGTVVVAEGGGWAAMLPGVPVHGDAGTSESAVDGLVEALREHAEDWDERLRSAPNHARHRTLVRIVEPSSDEDGSGTPPEAWWTRRDHGVSRPGTRRDHATFCRREGWSEVRNTRGRAVDHRRPLDRAQVVAAVLSRALPAGLVQQLLRAGTSSEGVAAMSLDEATAAMVEHWSRPRG